MGAETLSSRAIIGMFYQQLEEARAQSWLPAIAARVDSDQPIEELAFLSSAPAMREWVGGRLAKGFDTRTIRIPNKHWEATIEFLVRELTRDKTGQVRVRIAELAQRAAAHPQKLISELLLAGETSLCYDGQFFFDTDHAEGQSGTQSNSITADITQLNVPIAQQGTPTAPSGWVLAEAIARTIRQFFTLRDDQGEPMHASAKRFLVMLPTSFLSAEQRATDELFSFDVPNILGQLPYEFQFLRNARLTWSDRFVVFRTDGDVRPFFHQVETEVALKAKAEGTDFAFDRDAHQYGVDQWSNVAYAHWQQAVLCRLV